MFRITVFLYLSFKVSNVSGGTLSTTDVLIKAEWVWPSVLMTAEWCLRSHAHLMPPPDGADVRSPGTQTEPAGGDIWRWAPDPPRGRELCRHTVGFFMIRQDHISEYQETTLFKYHMAMSHKYWKGAFCSQCLDISAGVWMWNGQLKDSRDSPSRAKCTA